MAMSTAELIKQLIDEEGAKQRALAIARQSQEGHPPVIDVAQAQAARDATFATSYGNPLTAPAPGVLRAQVADPTVTAAGPAYAPTNPYATPDAANAARAQAQAATAAQAQRYNTWLASQEQSAGTRQSSLGNALVSQLNQDEQRRVGTNQVNQMLARNQVQNDELNRLRQVQGQARQTYNEQYAYDINEQTKRAQEALAAMGSGSGGGGAAKSTPGRITPTYSAPPPAAPLPTFSVPTFNPGAPKKPAPSRGSLIRRS